MNLRALLVVVVATLATRSATAAEVVREVRVHGHRSGSEGAILAIAQIAVGDAIAETTLADLETRLRASGRFTWVEVRKRYRSLTVVDDVAILIAVRERPRLRDKLQLLPALGYDDAYGFSLGGQVGLLDAMGGGERFGVIATGGAEHLLSVELGRATHGGMVDDVRAFASIRHRDFAPDDRREERTSVGLSARRALGAGFVDASYTWSHVELGELGDRYSALEVGVGVDTRGDRSFPRDGVYLRGAWRGLAGVSDGSVTHRMVFDLRAYHPGWGRSIVALRGTVDTGGAVPDHERPWVGGTSTLRGHRAGERLGDRAVSAGIELRLPLTNPVGLGRAGIAAFFDTAAAWSVSTPARFGRGAGLGFFADATLFNARIDFASDLDGGTRIHLQSGVRF